MLLNISNVNVYDLKESVIASGNAMRLTPAEYTDTEFTEGLERCAKLAKAGGGSGHPNFRTGIRVSFDIQYPQYWSMEAQRYHFLDIVSSSSKMHRLLQMDIIKSCNDYVDCIVIDNLKQLISDYNKYCKSDLCNESTRQMLWQRIISNCPMGLMLFMRVSTNYEQLATIYRQRKNHKLLEWRMFCDWIETLPYSKELITCKD